MLETLSERLQAALSDVRSRGTLSEGDVKAAMRQIRMALLEADVNLGVVKSFTATVGERAGGRNVLASLNPGKQVAGIVGEELTALLGSARSELERSSSLPTVILMAGLQGSGKTTATAKLALYLRDHESLDVAVAACDVHRPAAIEQLSKVAGQAGATVYERGADEAAASVAEWALGRARAEGRDVLIVDTAGRLGVDGAMMAELVAVRDAIEPDEVLLVVDAMTGQDAVAVAEAFAAAVDFSGVVLSKLDGDARGGAALSIAAVTGRPVKFASTGERLEAFEPFHPDRMAQRILGMGDVTTLVERAERELDRDQARELERKVRRDEFTLDDFLGQLNQIRRMGPLTGLLSMIPGLGAKQLAGLDVDERELDRIGAIITSMTPAERANPDVIDASRRRRIAFGSGTSVQAVNQLVKQFAQMRKLMRQVASGKMPSLQGLVGGR